MTSKIKEDDAPCTEAKEGNSATASDMVVSGAIFLFTLKSCFPVIIAIFS